MSEQWYAKTPPEAFSLLGSAELGLAPEEAVRRLKERGYNTLPEPRPDPLILVFIRQFQSPLIYILLAASIIVYFLGKPVDAAIILAVLVFNAIVGTAQEGRAQKTLSALRNFVETKATVLRDGKELIIPDREVAEGDIIVLSEGEKVPADARVILSNSLKLDEAALTGESTPVEKTADVLPSRDVAGGEAELSSADQKNMLFKGTYVVAGSGKAVVVSTGERTVIGKIATEIAGIDTEVPLRRNINALSRVIIGIVVCINAILFTSGILLGKSVVEMFTTVVALSVSIIPAGLPIVITLVLATGVWRMSKRNALVKKLQAVEALGQAQVIAVDKTGTITRNELVVERVYADGKTYTIGGVGYEPKGSVSLGAETVDPAAHETLRHVGRLAAFCANARVIYSEDEKRYRVSGDPTEAALLVLSQKLGFHKEALEHEFPLLFEIPFGSGHKFHATVHQEGGRRFLTVVGAPESVLALSRCVAKGGEIRPLTEEERHELEETLVLLSREGLRVVAVAERQDIDGDTVDAEHLPPLTFVGFFGMKDALRPEVAGAMERAREAGIKVVMITGDHRVTAQAIAREAGIFHEGDTVLTGAEIDEMDDRQLRARLKDITVFARVTPEHKMRIIEAYRARGEIIAMTGDGVNDAPSLVAADLGVAMGGIGTEVAREASDIVLLDDNFGSIVSAVEEGRSMYKTIKKVVLYLFSTSLGEVLTISAALFMGLPIPLLPAQIIWLNFVTDGFLVAAFAMEPKERGLLRGVFAQPKKYIVDGLMVRRMLLMAFAMAVGTLILFAMYQDDFVKALTVSLTVLAVYQWFNVWNCRSEQDSVFSTSPFTNPFLVGATITIVGLQLVAVYHPLFQSMLSTTALSLADWFLILSTALSIVLVEETRKFFHRTAWSKRVDKELHQAPTPVI